MKYNKHIKPTEGPRRLWRPMRALLLAAGLLPLATGFAEAQDASEPLAADINTLQVRLSSGHTVTLKYALSGGNLFYFPVLGLKSAELLDSAGRSIPFIATNGVLQIPGSLPGARMCATIYDYMKDVSIQNEILGILRSNSFIVASPPGPIPKPAAMQPERLARLVLSDSSGGNQRRVLATSLVNDADGNPEPKAIFRLAPDGLAALGSAGNARLVNVEIEESYRARFYTNDVMVSLTTASESLAFTMLSLDSMPDKGRPTLLLSSRLPVQVPPGGPIERDVDFSSRVGSECRLTVYTRPGTSADPQLVQTLVNAALERSRMQFEIQARERASAIARVLLPDGLSITLPVAHLHEIAADMLTDRERRWNSAFTHASRNSGAVYVNTDFGVNVLDIFGGSGSVDTAVLWDNSDYVNQRVSEYSRLLEAMSVRLAGDIPVVTGMRITDSGTVTNVNFDQLEGIIGHFTVGLASLSNRRSLMEYAATLDRARQVEALLVHRTEVGSANVGSSQNWTRSGTSLYRDQTVVFEHPFARPPKVIASIGGLDSDARPNYIRLGTEVRSVTERGFTLRFTSRYDGETAWVYSASAQWVATGEGQLSTPTSRGLADIGAPNTLPLIAGDVRELAMTPHLWFGDSTDGDWTATLSTIPGRSYTLQSSTNLVDWQTRVSGKAEDFGLAMTLPYEGSVSHEFFRVTAH